MQNRLEGIGNKGMLLKSVPFGVRHERREARAQNWLLTASKDFSQKQNRTQC